jgi:hypothetical protein
MPPHLPSTYIADFEEGLQHVSGAARLYWATFLFELIYLAGVVWFCFRPFIRRAGMGRQFIHVAIFPFLLYLPLWFGYCNPASRSFPIGGILYPYLNAPAACFPNNFDWEFRFLAILPPCLTAITQGRAVTFADCFTLKYGSPVIFGPVNVALLSLLLTAILAAVYGAKRAFQKFRGRHQRRGFPVLNVHLAEDVPPQIAISEMLPPVDAPSPRN